MAVKWSLQQNESFILSASLIENNWDKKKMTFVKISKSLFQWSDKMATSKRMICLAGEIQLVLATQLFSVNLTYP